MGLKIKDIIVKEEISIRDLNKKIVAIDAMNMLYQFLTTIRQPDGKALTNSKGKVTSHLIGLFSRTTNFMEKGLKPIFVFDGKAPDIKIKTWEKRRELKKEASLKLQEAEEAGDIEAMKKFAGRTVKLDKEMIEDAKRLIKSLGIPVVQAPSEGEAQTAYMVKTGVAYASISQDYDNLIFGCPLLVRNLSVEGKRKKVGKFAYKTVKPEIIKLEEVLKELGIDRDQLIILAILVGTDYNPDGIKGIGQKKALKLIKEHENNLDKMFEVVEWEKHYPEISWKQIFDTIKNMPVIDVKELEWQKINDEEVISLLVDDYEFGRDRVESKLDKLRKQQNELKQTGLNSFF